MISTGKIRKVDKTGRVIVPKNVLGEIDIQHLDNIGVRVRDNYIVISNKVDKTCDVRKIDKLSRFPIPANIRRIFKIEPDDLMELFICKTEGEILIKKLYVNCEICNSNNDVVLFKDKKLCAKCVEEIKNL